MKSVWSIDTIHAEDDGLYTHKVFPSIILVLFVLILLELT